MATNTSSTMPVKKAMKRRSTLTGGVIKKPKLSRPEPPNSKSPSGIVLTCGQGELGQLGLGEDIMQRSRPTLVPDLENVVDICAGGVHTVCLTKSGEVITFGCNDDGALGRDTSEEGSEMIPGLVQLEGKVVQISAGDSHSAVLLSDGRVFAWGSFRDSVGNLGLLIPKETEKQPVEMLPGTVVVKIASGADHLVMLSEDGHLFTCGCGEQGQLGRVSERGANRETRQGIGHFLKPYPVTFKPRHVPEFEDIWASTYCTYAKEKSQGEIYVFGLNNFFQLGLKEQRLHFYPRVSEVFSGKTWVKICGGEHHSIALDSDGIVYCMGRHDYGRLGLGPNCEDADRPTPIPTLSEKKCKDVSCGSRSSFAVTHQGELFVWGAGYTEQLGTGKEDDVDAPQLLTSKQLEARSVLQVSGGATHTVILATDTRQ